jgi:hypothetical protein
VIHPRPAAASVALVLCVGLLAACTTAPTSSQASLSRTSTASAAPTVSNSPSASPTPSPTPTFTVTDSATPEPTWFSPLTGLPGEGPKPVLVVKLDNTRYAQPHSGLTKADVVYMEEVEYGITRLAAVFSSRVPDRIGPVRSARITDVDLLAQYGRPAFAYSGAQRKMFPVLDAAPFHDVSPRRGDSGYSRDYSRRAPYNYYLNGKVALARAPKSSLAKDVGFTFSEDPPEGGLVARRASMAWGYSSAQFDFSRKRDGYRVDLNGVPARTEERASGPLASTVVIQYVKQTPSRYFDKGGGNTPHAQTIGSGRGWVLRDGLAWKVAWSRPSAKDGTTYTLEDGTQMPFKPGQTWVVLLDSKRRAKITPLTEPSSTPTPVPSPTPSPRPSS